MNSGVHTGSSMGRPNPYQMTPAQMQQAKQQELIKQQQQQQQQSRPRPNIQNYQFASTSQDILRKYAKYPASLNLHIYESHYRFNNSQDSNIIPKNSPMIKDFLHHALKEQIPVEMSELLKDFSIRSYDGCLILQVYDHRHMVSTVGSISRETKPDAKQEESNGKDLVSSPATTQVSKPKTYRTLLRPTQLSLYYDLLYHTDSALTKFTDPLSLQMESEIHTLTQRKLNLSVPLNPYLCDDFLKPEVDYPKKVWDEKTGDYKLIHLHREGVENPPRKLHQDELVLHKSSDYEELMLLLSNKYKKSDETQEKKLVVVGGSSANVPKPGFKEGTTGPDIKPKKGEKPSSIPGPGATVNHIQTSTRSTGQFMRLRLIEEIRKKREAEKSQQEAKIQAQANAINQNNNRPIITQNEKNPMANSVPHHQVQPSVQLIGETNPMNQAKHQMQQSLNQPVPKKMKKEPQQMPQMNAQNQPHIQAQQQYKQGSNQNQPGANVASQQVSNGMMMNQQRMQQNSGPSNTPQQPQQTQTQSQPALQQHQQQQIFQNSLTLEEQQAFRQLQSRMSAFAQMGNLGVAPNGQQLNPQQQQQALQQAKLIQQQLVQKFPVYFQRLRQFQLIQQQRQQKLQQQQNDKNIPGGSGMQTPNNIAETKPQYNQMMNQQSQQSPKSLDKKKRIYKKK